MNLKIILKTLIENYLTLESAYNNMTPLITYLTNRNIKFNPHMREAFAKYVESDKKLYDRIFDYIGDFADIDRIVSEEEYAEQVFNALPEDDRERFKNQKPDMSEAMFEPSYKFLDIEEQLPPDTMIVRFLKDKYYESVKIGGFPIGTSDLSRLHSTLTFKKDDVGFIYGYVADSPEAARQSKAETVGQTYGRSCIFFRYPALLVYHKLDDELQAIVYGGDVQVENAIFAKGLEDGTFIIENGGFDKTPKSYTEVVQTLKKI